MKHTPGPWYTIWVDGTYVIDANSGKTDVAHVLNRGNPDTTEANARLIAAAPQMLAALDDCITNENCTAIATCDVAYMIRRFKAINEICSAAIAKAEGRST